MKKPLSSERRHDRQTNRHAEKRWRAASLAAVLATALVAARCQADPQSTPTATLPSPTDPAGSMTDQAANHDTVITIIVHAKSSPTPLPKTNASETTISSAPIQRSDPTLTLPEIISTYVPGASLNENDGLRIRGADDQFSTYVDGIPLPQNVNGALTDVVDPSDIRTLRVYTGGVPAELGGQLAAIFDITTKTGEGKPAGNIAQSVAQAGTYDTQGYVEGGLGKLGYFVSGSHRSTDFFLNPPVETAENDGGHEDHGFGKLNYNPTATDSYVLLFGSNGSRFDVPSTSDTQDETGEYVGLTWRHTCGAAFSRASVYTRTSTLRYNGSPSDPDVDGLLDTNQNLRANTTGIRADQTVPFGRHHVAKAGFEVEKTTVDQNLSIGLPTPPDGPGGALADVSGPHSWNVGIYAQDDWTPGRFLINYGVRFDENSEDITTNQVSPRINVKYRLNNFDIVHAYYDRLFQPIPLETAAHLVGQPVIGDNGTVSPLHPEVDDFYEIGIDHVTPHFSAGVAAYYKPGTNVRDDDQVGDTGITLPVDDAKSYARGIEFNTSHDFSATLHGFANLALAWSKNDGPITGGLNEGDTPSFYVNDDHTQTYTSTFGATYVQRGLFADLVGLYGSGQPYGVLTDTDGNVTAENYLTVEPHLIFNGDIGKKFVSGFELSVFADNLLNDAYVIKQTTSLSDALWAQGRILGVRASQDF